MERFANFAGVLLLVLAAGCVSPSIRHDVSYPLTGATSVTAPEPVNERSITAENADAQAKALWDELDREEYQLAAQQANDAKPHRH